MSEEQQASTAQASGLVDPNVPADQGLSSLGLLMQLAGSLFAGYGALVMFTFMLGMSNEQKGMLMVICAASITRSIFHRLAGSDLLYRRASLEGVSSPLLGLKRYVLVGLAHTVLCVVIFKYKLHVPGKAAAAIGAGLALWPLAIGVMLQLPRFKRFNTELPVPEDKGFEGASILMAVLGTCGVLGTGALLYLMVDKMDALLSQGPGILVLVAVVMLFIRSIFHVQAGLSGLRETSVDRSVELANRYSNFGVIASFCAAGAVLLVSMMGSPNIGILAVISCLCWLLLSWPMIIRRFFSDRQFVDLMSGDGASLHRRSPDAGLTGLGWLLVCMSVFSASLMMPRVLLGDDFGMGKLTDMMYMLAPSGFRSMWWNIGLIALQAWAGFELIRMSPYARIIGSVYAVAAALITIYVSWPMMKVFSRFARDPEMFISFIPIAISLVVPVATLVLVNRKITPTATARFRDPSSAPR